MPNLDIPPRCQGVCPFDEADLAKYHLTPTRNWRGPNVSVGEIIARVTLNPDGTAVSQQSDLLQIERSEDGDTITLSKVFDSDAGEVACRNAGINRSIDSQLTVS